MQIYQNHVVFQSFSDLYCLEQRRESLKAIKSQQQKQQQRVQIAASSATDSDSTQSSPASSRAPSLFHDLSRSSSQQSTTDSVATSVDDGAQYYPAGLYSSTVERRLQDKEADVATLADMPMLHTGGQDLSLRRF